ncbi:extensin family protein [Thioclava sp. BHET1]|nr:extensin family protein [Thioclava sp. BHET1]
MTRRTKLLIEGLRWLSRAGLVAALVATGWFWLGRPDVPIPSAWNPRAPLVISDPITPFTRAKFATALRSPERCRAALETGAGFTALPDLTPENPACGIANRVTLRRAAAVSLRPLETRCDLALRVAMWTEHGLKPMAQELLGTRLTAIDHLSSYNCRPIRTPSGQSSRMSLHATAEAIDISGFRFADGTRLVLKRDWDSPDGAAFLRAARDTACRWFATTLGPEFNALHADHFHLQSRGWGRCS